MKNAVVTGASRGIGAEIAKELCRLGYRVFAVYNSSRHSAEALCREVGAVAVKCDVSSAAEVEALACEVERFGGADVVVNCAGVAGQFMLCDITEAEWDRVFDINVKGTFLVTKALMGSMISKKNGAIINISSMWGEVGASCEVHYSASKAAVIGFTKALAKELGPSGVRVNCVSPGVIDTGMNSHLSSEDMDALTDETPLMRIGKCSDCAKAVAFLAGDDAAFITGQVLSVNGGFVV